MINLAFEILRPGFHSVHHAIADSIQERLVRELALKPKHVEGLRAADWVLMDYVDFVVHIFHPTLRQFYQLERLWADAPVVGSSL